MDFRNLQNKSNIQKDTYILDVNSDSGDYFNACEKCVIFISEDSLINPSLELTVHDFCCKKLHQQHLIILN